MVSQKKYASGRWACSRPKWAEQKRRFGVCGPTQTSQIKHDLGSIYVGPLEMPLKLINMIFQFFN
jgi:hypothetical protein